MKFYAELLIFFLLFLVNFRVFLPKKERRDVLVSVSPITFLLSILSFFAWGFDFFIFLAIILSFLVLLTNFHAMFRYSQKVYVDHYSPAMKFWAIFTTIFSFASIVIVIYFAPVLQNPKDFSVTETKQNITGNLQGGFSPSQNFEKVNGTIYEFSLAPELENRSYAVLFLPDRRGDVANYEPFLKSLAKEGTTVFSADFYTNDCKYFSNFFDNKLFRRFCLVLQSRRDPQKYNSQREFFTYKASLELEALLKLAQEKYGSQCRYFIATDIMGNTAANDIQKKYPELITGTLDISTISEYKTAGFGFVEITEPLLARFLGCKKDSKMENSTIVAKKTAKIAKNSWGIGR